VRKKKANEANVPLRRCSMHKLHVMASLNCDWPSCKLQCVFETVRDRQIHVTNIHVADVLANWGGKCSWPGCQSKIVFKSKSRLETHVFNIHLTPLRCTVADCKHQRPFERQADLDRHTAAKHSSDRKYKCSHSECYYSILGFSRKDKLKLHLRYHEEFTCVLNHCSHISISEEGRLQHRKSRIHCDYECALGACVRGGPSRFSYWGLYGHLISDHNVLRMIAGKIIPRESPNLTVNSNSFIDHDIPDFQDCAACLKLDNRSEPAELNTDLV
jgi:hypothetical protein